MKKNIAILDFANSTVTVMTLPKELKSDTAIERWIADKFSTEVQYIIGTFKLTVEL